MSALGQKQTFALQNGMSASPPKATKWNVRFGPGADIDDVLTTILTFHELRITYCASGAHRSRPFKAYRPKHCT